MSETGKKALHWLRYLRNRSWRFPHVLLVTGSPRSGTHLLNSILSSSDQVSPLLTESWPLVHIINSFSLTRMHTNRYPGHYLGGKDDVINLYRPVLLDFILRTHRRYKKPFLVFRVPSLAKHIRPLATLLDFFCIRFNVLVMVRDPRDVLSSLKTINHNLSEAGEDPLSSSMEKICMEFIAEYYKPLMNLSIKNITYIRYEDLTANPQEKAREIGATIGLDLSNYNAESDWKNVKKDWTILEDQKQQAWVTPLYQKGVTSSSVGRYKSVLSPEEIATVENSMGAFLKTFGYSRDSEERQEKDAA